ncbi:LOW QUALITY PROTEIN: uncharacterized protein LOC102674860 [Apis dorsata]|uniref:LOW QUALITY PROTEIN: uncharacterized protein LOC102674860 n=1 Tax=Apis dorsata TaxID=7462 RepID=UPI001292F71F|nr:LOW QUALITY PROTEIN: uncharacterized protein LOC102674860 [Apis dorsata]
MNFLESDVSVSLTSIFMKLVGIWMAGNQYEQRIRNITVIYSLVAIIFALWIQSMNIFYSWGDFSACLFFISNILSSIMPLLKIIILFSHREDFFRLILYMKRNFLELRHYRLREEDRDRLQAEVHLLHLFLYVSYNGDCCFLHLQSNYRKYWKKRIRQNASIQHVD